MKNSIRVLMSVMSVVIFAAADEKPVVRIDGTVPDFTLQDNTGTEHKLSGYRGKVVVLEWTNPDCPFVKKHYDTKNMQKLQKEATSGDVVWFTICSSAKGKQGHYTGKELNKRLKTMKPAHTAYLIDADGKVGKLFGAKTTPHMFIINPEGELVYAGAIDNRPSTKKEDVNGATNYVRTALGEVLAGKKVSVKATQPYGWSVKY